ncbi:HET-domain-containing protein [Massarina eburnea CBS 473.64]|uniref:HET-domain-containing protein n=1 Tax=Massarina eburnea CBS 473.64 TaxID=1395130 RepID=A0A6A6S6Q3_9PLEO|nr:HET-domain-containing protein [Massarina eburnea CBS 473.64]
MLLQHWINDCNIKHVCRPKDPVLPKRLIDLSATKNPGILKLDCSKDRSDSNYAALSHRWGDPNLHREFRLQKDNLSQWQRQLELKKLPKTFRDAVTITRMLGIRYLWIDSLCIVQNSIEDWRAECQKMEEVFSSAYVTLSATCSNGTSDGFLKPHPEEGPKARTYSPINVPTANGRSSRVYICNAIDDFKRDVEEAELSTRGWVFQERALSRRVLHFTDTQMYWECGKGVRCETMMRMYNRKSSFLSDPNFPESMASHYKGMRIIFFENIYEKYSQLSFTYWRDRAVALAGIERRLARVYATRARYGILDHSDRSYLRRSLLWQRAVSDAAPREQHSLPKIEFGAGQEVPSWSWMAVMGAIEYMPVPFDVVDWDASLKWVSESEKREELVGRAKDADGSGNIEGIIWDRPEESERENLRMVIVGTERTYGVGDVSKHYVIVVASIPGPSGVVWERVGVGAVVKEPGWIEGLTWIRVE